MRRALLHQLPALSHHYGLKPADLDEMTFAEVEEYVRQLVDYQRRTREQQRKG